VDLILIASLLHAFAALSAHEMFAAQQNAKR